MLVVKGGVYRNIPDSKLQEYKDKGYRPAEEKAPSKGKEKVGGK